MTQPNFLLIGAAKTATTSLYRYLAQHPQIYLPENKEPRFFLFEGANPKDFKGPGDSIWVSKATRSWEDYLQLFEGATAQHRAIGEGTTLYLPSPEAAARIHHYLPAARLIAVLRDPADRAFSHFLQHLRGGHGLETVAQGNEAVMAAFCEVLDREEERRQAGWSMSWQYQWQGFYHQHLTTYGRYFPRDRIQVLLFEDVLADLQGSLRTVLQFLEVDDGVVLDTSHRHNSSRVTQVPKNERLHRFLIRDNPLKSLLKPLLPAKVRSQLNWTLRQRNMQPVEEPLTLVLTPEVRQRLIEVYREDILRLQDWLGRDLGAWLTVERAPRAGRGAIAATALQFSTNP